MVATTSGMSNGLNQELMRKMAEDNIFGKLTNWRPFVGNTDSHKSKVLSGLNKIDALVLKGQKVQVNKIKG